ncbi:hypothetical protein [Streptomyces sp. NBC_01012]|nr:hypothetical protein OG623_02365 [Streptomyces sp. NBC_01012]
MALTLELIRHDVADILGRSASDIPVDADFADLAEQPAIDGWAPLLEAS